MRIGATNVVWPPDLFEHGPAEVLALGARLELAAHDRQRGLQTVSEIGERVAVALQVIAFAADEFVEIRGQPRQLARVTIGQAFLLAVLDPRQVAGDPA